MGKGATRVSAMRTGVVRYANSMPIELIIQWVAFIYSDNKKAKYASNLSKITRSIEEAECNIAVSSL